MKFSKIKWCTTLAVACMSSHSLLASATTLEEGYGQLSSYAEIKTQLSEISEKARHNFEYGPLIRSGYNGGLIDIDMPLSMVDSSTINHDVCGAGTNPSLREAVTCTIEPGGRGNTDISKIGQSTHGRDLLAVRMGNPHGPRVMVIAQQHGNEPASTEAVLKVIKKWSKKRIKSKSKHPINNLDLLFLVRANPDGGEPTTECTNFLTPGAPNFNTCAFTRMNVDSSAGGGFAANTEAGFYGVVGQGYNLNRYHYVNLDSAIRPVENQAMVAAALAFDPDYVLDLHGDVPKSDCELDLTTLTPNAVLGQLPSVECVGDNEVEDEVRRVFSVFANDDDGTDISTASRSLGGRLLNRMESTSEGTVGRFAQLDLGAGAVNSGAAPGAYSDLGAVPGGWESANFGLAGRPDIGSFVNGVPSFIENTWTIDPEFIASQIDLNVKALKKSLRIISRFQRRPQAALNDNAFCEFSVPSGQIAVTPTALFGEVGSDDPQMIPFLPSIGIPLAVGGTCPSDN